MNGPVSSRILIAENDQDTRGLLATWLEGAGFERAPTSMAGALAEAERRVPDAALVSFDATDGDAIEVAHRLVNWPDAARHVSALLREEIAQTRDEMKALVAGADGRQAQTLLLELLAERSRETYEHALRVTRMATRLARALHVPLEHIPDIRRAALLHDIGKVAVPSRILNSRTRPTEDDVFALRLHVTIGEEILSTVPRLATAGVLVAATHEHYDGRGYPSRLRGGAIPFGSRIIAVADVYDAMTSIRPYRDPLTHEEANAELLRVAGSQLDPDVVRGWIGMTESRAC